MSFHVHGCMALLGCALWLCTLVAVCIRHMLSAYLIMEPPHTPMHCTHTHPYFTHPHTPCTQAYGAGNYRQVGIVLQRGFVVNIVAALIVVLFVWLPIKPLLIAAGMWCCWFGMCCAVVLCCCHSMWLFCVVIVLCTVCV